MSPKDVEAEYGFSEQTLRNWRYTGNGPAFIKTRPGKGGRIRYRRSVIEAWLDEHTVRGSAA